MRRNILARRDLDLAARCFADACRVSREHTDLARAAMLKYGDHGPNISGCVREHFPEAVKAELRLLAKTVALYTDAAWAHKPKRVRYQTMLFLASAVAARDGAGFYGPQPFLH
jgi:hypothetical protein